MNIESGHNWNKVNQIVCVIIVIPAISQTTQKIKALKENAWYILYFTDILPKNLDYGISEINERVTLFFFSRNTFEGRNWKGKSCETYFTWSIVFSERISQTTTLHFHEIKSNHTYFNVLSYISKTCHLVECSISIQCVYFFIVMDCCTEYYIINSGYSSDEVGAQIVLFGLSLLGLSFAHLRSPEKKKIVNAHTVYKYPC